VDKQESKTADKITAKIHTWPYLVRLEFLCILIIMVILIVWSITLDAPLEELGNPTKTPNPSKAPWYFLGLQELLVYFDPWIAGVVLPSIIVIGLMAIPYIDINPKGNGYYSFSDRKFAILTFLFGFLVLWVTPIIIGVFFRGPGWNFFWPWQEWDPHKVVALTNINLPYWGPFGWLGKKFPILDNPTIFGIEIIGLVAISCWYSIGVLFYFWKRNEPFMKELGLIRYCIIAFLFLTMMAIPIKMFLRIAFNIKYVWSTPFFYI